MGEVDKATPYELGYFAAAKQGWSRERLASLRGLVADDYFEQMVMGYEDALGDAYTAEVHPPKPPLDLSANQKIKDTVGYRYYADEMEQRKSKRRKWYDKWFKY